MGKYGIALVNSICAVCGEKFVTSSRKQKCHDQCREEYYRRYYKERYRREHSGHVSTAASLRAAASWHVNTHICAVPGCGYSKITRDVTIRKETETTVVKLCPKHWAEYRLGFLEAWTWAAKDEARLLERSQGGAPALETPAA
jgi:predicted RNA-binding Zn-ribbon protein involved in translation (DUF1610 family)